MKIAEPPKYQHLQNVYLSVDLKMVRGTNSHSSSFLPMDRMHVLRGFKMSGGDGQARGMPILMGMGLKMGMGMGIGQGLRGVAVFLILLSLSPILADSRENKGERYIILNFTFFSASKVSLCPS